MITEVQETELERIVKNESKRFEGKVFAFVPVTQPNPRAEFPFIVCVAVLGESGYSMPLVPIMHRTYNGAADMADRLNRHFPYSPETLIAIIADTMERSRYKTEAERLTPYDRVYQVFVSFKSEYQAQLNEDELMDYIADEIMSTFSVQNVDVELK